MMKFLIVLVNLTVLLSWSVTSVFAITGGVNGKAGGGYGYNHNHNYGYNHNTTGYGNGYGYNQNNNGYGGYKSNGSGGGRAGASGGVGGGLNIGIGGGFHAKRPNAPKVTTPSTMSNEDTPDAPDETEPTTDEPTTVEPTTDEPTTDEPTTELTTTEIPTTTEPYCPQYAIYNSVLHEIRTDETFPNGNIKFVYECFGESDFYTGGGIGYQNAKPPNKAKCSPGRYIGAKAVIYVEDGNITDYKMSCNVMYASVVTGDRVTKSSLDFNNTMVKCDDYQVIGAFQAIPQDDGSYEIKIDCQPLVRDDQDDPDE